MTTGQRIARKRREMGLSQEQLGQEMGVSRQSIYKWESDAALPEIDKLIALSRGTWAGIDYGNVVTEELAAQVRVESIRVGLFRDRQLVCWMTETDDGDAGIWASYQLPRELPLIDGADYCVAAVVLDSVGRELVWSSDFMRWNADSRDFESDPVYSPDYWDKTLWSY